MSDVRFESVSKSYGGVAAVRDVDLVVAPGEFVTLLGPSGCGKTTCLRMVAGFVAPTGGRIMLGGRDVTRLPPHRRNTGMVFQSYALFPHQTVAENIAFGLKVRRVSGAERSRRVVEALRLVRMEGLADRYPAQLSGGQRQRVALARAVVIEPDVLLLDEPLAALDLKLREELQVEIKRIQTALNMTTIFVTHDQGEALGMSDRVAVLRDGRIMQIAAPATLYERPNSRYVANFLGRTNIVPVVVRGAEAAAGYRVEAVEHGGASFAVASGPPGLAVGDRCLLAARPENCHIGTGGAVTATVRSVIYRGAAWHVELSDVSGTEFTVLARSGDDIPAPGSRVAMGWQPERCFLLAAD